MIDIISDIRGWVDQNKKFALASVVRTWGSSPRLVGSAMAIGEDMTFHGSVSGGCVEGVVIEEALQVIETGKPKHLTFSVSNDEAWSVGLTCGGKLEVLVERFLTTNGESSERDIWDGFSQALAQNRPCYLAHAISGDSSAHRLMFPDSEAVGTFGDSELDGLAREVYDNRKSQMIEWKGQEIFVNVFPRKDKLILIGAAHISIELVRMAREFEFETMVIDPRGIFASPDRFPSPPDQLFSSWPEEVLPGIPLDEDTYAVLLTHDPKIDDQAIHLLLNSEVAYIGALGSKKTQTSRRNRLERDGFSSDQIERIFGPVGLPIDAKTPQEIALSIMGEIIKVKYQRETLKS